MGGLGGGRVRQTDGATTRRRASAAAAGRGPGGTVRGQGWLMFTTAAVPVLSALTVVGESVSGLNTCNCGKHSS